MAIKNTLFLHDGWDLSISGRRVFSRYLEVNMFTICFVPSKGVPQRVEPHLSSTIAATAHWLRCVLGGILQMTSFLGLVPVCLQWWSVTTRCRPRREPLTYGDFGGKTEVSKYGEVGVAYDYRPFPPVSWVVVLNGANSFAFALQLSLKLKAL